MIVQISAFAEIRNVVNKFHSQKLMH